MTKRYRLINFAPNPVVDWEVPVGALVQGGDGRIEFVQSTILPDSHCLGGADRASLLRDAVHELAEHRDFDNLPFGLGPQFSLAPTPNVVPDAVDNPARWVMSLLFQGMGTEPRVRGARRATEGWRFLTLYNVEKLVRKNYKHPGLKAITHFVRGQSLLLMEPLVVSRSRWQDDAEAVSTRFQAYRGLLGREGVAEQPRLIAYLPPGGTADSRDKCLHMLELHADDVVDGASQADALTFAATIRAVASSSPLMH